jgi:hypothetical protein
MFLKNKNSNFIIKTNQTQFPKPNTVRSSTTEKVLLKDRFGNMTGRKIIWEPKNRKPLSNNYKKVVYKKWDQMLDDQHNLLRNLVPLRIPYKDDKFMKDIFEPPSLDSLSDLDLYRQKGDAMILSEILTRTTQPSLMRKNLINLEKMKTWGLNPKTGLGEDRNSVLNQDSLSLGESPG